MGTFFMDLPATCLGVGLCQEPLTVIQGTHLVCVLFLIDYCPVRECENSGVPVCECSYRTIIGMQPIGQL